LPQREREKVEYGILPPDEVNNVFDDVFVVKTKRSAVAVDAVQKPLPLAPSDVAPFSPVPTTLGALPRPAVSTEVSLGRMPVVEVSACVVCDLCN
jgi:hypothetical protein